MDIRTLCDTVRNTAYAIHLYLGQGHLEKVYENALVHRLRKQGIQVEQQYPVKVYDEDGTGIGDYVADILVEGILIVELKAAKVLAAEHTAQILGYLRDTNMEHGLLINFGSYKFQIKKYIWNHEEWNSFLYFEHLLCAFCVLCGKLQNQLMPLRASRIWLTISWLTR